MLSRLFPNNEGPTDRAIRLALALVLIPVGLFALDGIDASVAGVIVAAVGFIGLVTGATGRCPTYVLLRISTVGGLHRVRPTTAIDTKPEIDRDLVSAGSTRRS
jgi:hypothetical protein